MLERLKVNPKYNQKAGPTLELLKESYSGLLNKKKYKKEYEEAVNYIWESVTKKLPFLIIGTTFDHWISFLYISQEKTEQIGLVGKHGLRSFTLKTQTDIPDSPKLVSSALPHFVHNLDALILTKVVLKCIDMNIRIYTSHDAYQTSPFYAQLIKDLYYEAFIEVTLKQDPIAIFLANNKIELSDYQTKMLDLFANDRKILLKKIELGLLVPSRYILC